jgi:hypothetical protein
MSCGNRDVRVDILRTGAENQEDGHQGALMLSKTQMLQTHALVEQLCVLILRDIFRRELSDTDRAT